MFQADKGQSVELQIELKLSTRDPIEYLEVVQDGKTVHEVRLDQWAKAGGNLPPVNFTKSGWFLIRAVTNNPKTFRFASTGPYYVEDRLRAASQQEGGPVLQSIGSMSVPAGSSSMTPQQKAEVLEYHRKARDFWQKKVAEANAD